MTKDVTMSVVCGTGLGMGEEGRYGRYSYKARFALYLYNMNNVMLPACLTVRTSCFLPLLLHLSCWTATGGRPAMFMFPAGDGHKRWTPAGYLYVNSHLIHVKVQADDFHLMGTSSV